MNFTNFVSTFGIFIFVGGIIGAAIVFFVLSRKHAQALGALQADKDTEEDVRNKTIARAQKLLEEQQKTLSEEKRLLEVTQKKIDDSQAKLEEDRKEIKLQKVSLLDHEKRLEQREEKLDFRLDEIEKKRQDLEAARIASDIREKEIEQLKSELTGKIAEIAKLSLEEARAILLQQTEEKYEKEFVSFIEKKKTEYKIREKEIAREILIKSIQQYAGDVTMEMTQTTIKLESDDIKGKLIGKEGRNITTFERCTGVSLIIDDTPDTVFISSFDLYRRYIAKKSLEELVADKRIQPARIEELVEKNQKDAEKVLYELGEKTLAEMGITGFPDEIISLIGKLRFRTSYGQNLLTHSKEVAYISEAIAKMLGADPAVAFKGGLIHDIGKALDHDIEGTHPEIGGKIARKYNLPDNIINIIEAHHEPAKMTCIETAIIQAADAISAVRPGARRMNVEQYLKRIAEIEELARNFSGVQKAYALSAGREVRVFVDASTMTDLAAEKLAFDIVKKIEADLTYPGEIKVLVIRESRYTEFAH